MEPGARAVRVESSERGGGAKGRGPVISGVSQLILCRCVVLNVLDVFWLCSLLGAVSCNNAEVGGNTKAAVCFVYVFPTTLSIGLDPPLEGSGPSRKVLKKGPL